jgi:hypothetical protein
MKELEKLIYDDCIQLEVIKLIENRYFSKNIEQNFTKLISILENSTSPKTINKILNTRLYTSKSEKTIKLETKKIQKSNNSLSELSITNLYEKYATFYDVQMRKHMKVMNIPTTSKTKDKIKDLSQEYNISVEILLLYIILNEINQIEKNNNYFQSIDNYFKETYDTIRYGGEFNLRMTSNIKIFDNMCHNVLFIKNKSIKKKFNNNNGIVKFILSFIFDKFCSNLEKDKYDKSEMKLFDEFLNIIKNSNKKVKDYKISKNSAELFFE